MKYEDFKKLAQICWPFDHLTSKTIDFLLMTNSTMWWSFVKISLKLWPGGDKHKYGQTDREKNACNQSIYEKNLRFSQVKITKCSKHGRSDGRADDGMWQDRRVAADVVGKQMLRAGRCCEPADVAVMAKAYTGCRWDSPLRFWPALYLVTPIVPLC